MTAIVFGILSAITVQAGDLYALSAPIYSRVMVVGDSIGVGVTNNTEDGTQAGWRQEFVQLAAAGGYRVDMVGQYSSGPATFREKQHQSLSGRQVGWALAGIASWMSIYDPDVVVLELGTNDILQPLNADDATTKTDSDRADTANQMSDLIDAVQAANPRAWIIVPTIPPVNGLSNNGSYPSAYWQARINSEYRALVAARMALGQRVRLAELNPTMTTSMISDGVHPNAAGYRLMGQRIAAAYLTLMDEWRGDSAPNVTVTAEATDTDELTVTVTAGAGNIEAIVLETIGNATADFDGEGASSTHPRSYVPGSPASSVSVVLARATASLDVLTRLVVYDENGPHAVLVSAGPEAI
ncbi:MAG: GDSL-type esterase/lipase family protein [Chloroflexota bacterium]